MTEPSEIKNRITGAEIVAFPKSADGPAPAAEKPGDDGPSSDETPSPAKGSRRKPQGRMQKRFSDGPGQIEDLNDEYALVLMGSKAVVLRERPEADVENRVRILSLDAFKSYLDNRYVITEYEKEMPGGAVETKRTAQKLAAYWLQSADRRTYDGVEFFPDPWLSRGNGLPEKPFRDGAKPSDNFFNLWRGFDLAPDGESAKAGRRAKYSVFWDHLLTNVCSGNADHAEWMFAWFAHMIQRPRERAGTAIVLRGGEGVGKTKIGEVIGSLFSSHYFLVDEPRYLTGNFNAHMASCILLQVDEGFWAGDKGAEGRLKGLITAPVQMIESKGIDPIRLRNYVRIMFSSNEDWVVPVGLDGRRFAVFDVANHVQRNFEYFGEMERELREGGRAALLADLLDYDLDAPAAPNVRLVPKTAALLEQKIRSFDPVTSWWFQRLCDGTTTHRAGSWKPVVPIVTLFNDYVRTAERVGVKRKAAETEFGIRLRKLIPGLTRRRAQEEIEVTGPDGRTETVMRRVWCFNLPDLLECRDAFAGAVGQEINWSEGVEDDGESGTGSDFSDESISPNG